MNDAKPLVNLESLETIFDKYNSDKGSNFHNYCRQYEELLRKYRHKNISLLEIGIFQGESLKIWKDVFPNAVRIVGIDINGKCKQYEDIQNNIHVEIGDATRIDTIRSVTSKFGNFDIILDDGSHINKDVIKSFEHLFPLLRDNGLYIVEDTICFKSYSHMDYQYPNHLLYFANFLPFLNQWRFDSQEGTKDHCVDPFKILKKTENIFEYSIDKIEFGCSYIAIHKKIRHHWIK